MSFYETRQPFARGPIAMSDNKWGNQEFTDSDSAVPTGRSQENPLDVAEELMTYLNHTFTPAAQNILGRVKDQSERAGFLNDALAHAEVIAEESLAAMNGAEAGASQAAENEDVHTPPTMTR